jgi:hypothetical protein
MGRCSCRQEASRHGVLQKKSIGGSSAARPSGGFKITDFFQKKPVPGRPKKKARNGVKGAGRPKTATEPKRKVCDPGDSEDDAEEREDAPQDAQKVQQPQRVSASCVCISCSRAIVLRRAERFIMLLEPLPCSRHLCCVMCARVGGGLHKVRRTGRTHARTHARTATQRHCAHARTSRFTN